jgi:serine/threonine protein kinase
MYVCASTPSHGTHVRTCAASPPPHQDESGGPYTEEEARGLARAMFSALHHCHKKHVVHRDLKVGSSRVRACVRAGGWMSE